MSGFLAVPVTQFFDDSGRVLSGGKFYTYEVGSTTPKASYSTIADAIAGTNPNTNPVVADSAGRMSIVLSGPTKCILKDSAGEASAGDTPAGTTIWTKDNVSSDNTVLDTEGKKLLQYVTAGSAVNYIKIENSASGDNLLIDTDGSDSAPGLDIKSKGGTGDVNITKLVAPSATLDSATLTSPSIDNATITNTSITQNTPLQVVATSSNAAEIQLAEQTTNGTNYVSLKAPANIAANKTFIIPATDGSASTPLITDGSGTLSFGTMVQTSATQTDQETATSSVKPVTPSVQQFHPSAAKCFIMADAAGNISTSYNVTSITDAGTGLLTVTIATDHSSANYVILGMVNAGGGTQNLGVKSQNAGSFQLQSDNTAGSIVDPTYFYGATFGDQ